MERTQAGASLAAISQQAGLHKDWPSRHLGRVDPAAAELARRAIRDRPDARWIPVLASLGYGDAASYLRDRHLAQYQTVHAIAAETGISHAAVESALSRHGLMRTPHAAKRHAAQQRAARVAESLGRDSIASYISRRRADGWTWTAISSESGQPPSWLRRHASEPGSTNCPHEQIRHQLPQRPSPGSMSTVTPATARRAFRRAEPIHGMIYFTPHGPDAYAEVGITHQRMAYFASRSAAMGQVPAEIIVATFFNFNPALIHRVIPAAWDIASPAQVLTARLAAVDRSLRQAWGDDVAGPQVREAADLARRAAERACGQPQGRPLFAGHATLPWPGTPHLVLWHAQTLLREYRGDGHVALLLTEGLDGLGALITHAATGSIAAEALRTSRGWSEEEWAAGVERIREQGWLAAEPQLALSAAGQQRRQSIEDRTDQLACYPYEALGEDGCARLAQLAGPLSAAVMAADLGFPAALTARYSPTS
jgi:hypothetical protein